MEKAKFVLSAPKEYWVLTPEERERLLNKCGPDGPVNKLIPDHLFSLEISDVCNVHDFMFVKAKSKKERKIADDLFLKNLDAKIEASSNNNFIKILRKVAARVYYTFVRLYSNLKPEQS